MAAASILAASHRRDAHATTQRGKFASIVKTFRNSITEPCVCRLTRAAPPASICRKYQMDPSRRNLRRAAFSCLHSTLWTTAMLVNTFRLCAQDNYEIQVYGSETVPAGATMVELHSNIT